MWFLNSISSSFNSRESDIHWLCRKFEPFFVTLSGLLMHFDRLFGSLIFWLVTLTMVATAIETYW